jgi:hypothetical protein
LAADEQDVHLLDRPERRAVLAEPDLLTRLAWFAEVNTVIMRRMALLRGAAATALVAEADGAHLEAMEVHVAAGTPGSAFQVWSHRDGDRHHVPDLVAVLRDSPVGRELSASCRVEDRHTRPRHGVLPGSTDPLLAFDVRRVVREHQKGVGAQVVDQRRNTSVSPREKVPLPIDSIAAASSGLPSR